MLNLEWFRTFKVIYETGTLSAAAQSLFISQPGVSLHLNSLESYTGFRLFERHSRKVIPTDRAKILYDYILQALTDLEQIETSIQSRSRTGKAVVSIGMCHTTFQRILEEHVCDLPFNLITRFGECTKINEELQNGTIDFTVSSQMLPDPNLIFTPFSDERIVLVCGGATDLSGLEEVIAQNDRAAIVKWLKNQRWFATAADMEHLKHFWLANFRELPGFSPDFILPYFGSILSCLKNGDGFTVIPSALCNTEIMEGSVKLAWPGAEVVENTLYFGKRRKPIYPKEIEHLENLLIDNWFPK